MLLMKKRMLAYLKMMDGILASGELKDPDALLSMHLQQIAFFQHERLIHLLVTLTFGVCALGMGLVLCLAFSPAALLLFALLLCLLIPYIFHYYLLENGVQKMYRQYDALLKISKV